MGVEPTTSLVFRPANGFADRREPPVPTPPYSEFQEEFQNGAHDEPGLAGPAQLVCSVKDVPWYEVNTVAKDQWPAVGCARHGARNMFICNTAWAHLLFANPKSCVNTIIVQWKCLKEERGISEKTSNTSTRLNRPIS